MRAQRHPNADLAGATRDRVGLDAVNADDREKERDYAEGPEDCCAQFDDPKIRRFFHQIRVRRHLQQRQVGIEIAQSLTQGRHHRYDRTSILAVKANVEVNAAVIDRKSTRLNSSHRCISYAVFCLKKKKYRGKYK